MKNKQVRIPTNQCELLFIQKHVYKIDMKELAYFINKSHATVRSYMAGHRTPPRDVLIDIQTFIGCCCEVRSFKEIKKKLNKSQFF